MIIMEYASTIIIFLNVHFEYISQNEYCTVDSNTNK